MLFQGRFFMFSPLKIFRRGNNVEAFLKHLENSQLGHSEKRFFLTAIITNVNAKQREVGLKALMELCRISENLLSDLRFCTHDVRDKDMAKEIINTIATIGLDRNDVWNELVSIAEDSYGNRTARSHARKICISYDKNQEQQYWENKEAEIHTHRDFIDALIEKLKKDTSGRLLPPL
jgi:hypothetical protein